MPLDVDAGTGAPLSPEELIDALDAIGFDPRDEAAFAACGSLLARLARDRHFLARLAVDELKQRCDGQSRANPYGAQVMLLRAPAGEYGLRANFWPAMEDSAYRASGPEAFFYGHAHDHNFTFLTVGYLGPGYRSDFWEFDDSDVVGLPGERVSLAYCGREALPEGRVLLYRRRRDVHAQLPPSSFSVSLNILGNAPEQLWRDQYRFDTDSGTIVSAMTTTPSQALLVAGVALGLGDAVDLAESYAMRHPSERMRLAAIDALAGRADRARYERYAGDVSAYVAGHCRQRLAALAD